MKRGVAIACLCGAALLPRCARAQAVAIAPSHGIAVAHDSMIELLTPNGKERVWKCDGLPYVATIAVGATRLAAVDPLDGRVLIAGLADGRALPVEAPGTPIDALFVHDDLYLLNRDAATLERIAADGSRTELPTGRYPQFLRRAGDKLYVYAGADGTIDEFTTSRFARARSVAVPPFATSFATEGGFAYLLYPDERKLIVFFLGSLTKAGERTIGRFPIDLAIGIGAAQAAPGQTPYDLFLAFGKWFGQKAGNQARFDSAPALVTIADPARRSLLQVEVGRPAPPIGSLVASQTLAFGTLRGLRLPAAADRVFSASRGWLAYDSAERVVYATVGEEVQEIASDVGPHAFQVGDGIVALWNGTLVVRKL